MRFVRLAIAQNRRSGHDGATEEKSDSSDASGASEWGGMENAGHRCQQDISGGFFRLGWNRSPSRMRRRMAGIRPMDQIGSHANDILRVRLAPPEQGTQPIRRIVHAIGRRNKNSFGKGLQCGHQPSVGTDILAESNFQSARLKFSYRRRNIVETMRKLLLAKFYPRVRSKRASRARGVKAGRAPVIVQPGKKAWRGANTPPRVEVARGTARRNSRASRRTTATRRTKP